MSPGRDGLWGYNVTVKRSTVSAHADTAGLKQ